MKKCSILCISLFFCAFSHAATTKFIIEQKAAHFERGKFQSTGVSAEGFVTLFPEVEEVFQERDIIKVWSFAEDKAGNYYFGTGDKARIYKHTHKGEKSLLKDFEGGVSVNSIVIDSASTLYAAINPGKCIQRISLKDASTQKICLESAYIWKLAIGRDGQIYAATGDPARIYRIDSQGKAQEIYSSTSESHFLSLTAADKLYFGSEGEGILYQHNLETGKTQVLFDSPEGEIKDIVSSPDGTIYISTASKLGKRLPKTFDYTDSFKLNGKQEDSPQEKQHKQNKKKPPIKNSIYKITASGNVTKLFTRENYLFLALARDPQNNIYAGTGESGLIYKIVGQDQAVIFADTHEEHILSLSITGDSLIATTAGIGKVIRASTKKLTEGHYTSQVFNAGGQAHWGHINWETPHTQQDEIKIFLRHGNTETPDTTWTKWRSPAQLTRHENISTGTIQGPTTQYIQYKADFRSTQETDAPILKKVYISYLQQNRAPEIKDIHLNYIIKKDEDNSSRFPQLIEPQTFSLQWKSSDPDYDILTHNIYIKETHRTRWHLLASGILENKHSFDSHKIPDGQYLFKVTVTDQSSNAAGTGQTAETTSELFRIDHTAPLFEDIKITEEAFTVKITGKIKDALSFIKMIQYSLNGTEWKYLASDDLIYDSFTETFTLKINKEDKDIHPLENSLVMRGIDAYHNFSVTHIIFDIHDTTQQSISDDAVPKAHKSRTAS